MKRFFTILLCIVLPIQSFAQTKPVVAVAGSLAPTYREFVKRVSEIYETLVFNNARLTINNVTLKNIQSGIAFAYFDKKTTKRYILLNYAYLYKKVWLNDTIKSREIIKTIIAHEWAHHYLAHIFEGRSIINERNADIVAGRILAQNGVDSKSIIGVNILFEKYQDAQHLKGEIRLDLMLKGFMTERIIKDGCLSKNSLNKIFENVAKTLKKSEENKTTMDFNIEMENSIKQQKDSLKRLINTKLISIVNNYFNQRQPDSNNTKELNISLVVDSLAKSLAIENKEDGFRIINAPKRDSVFFSEENIRSFLKPIDEVNLQNKKLEELLKSKIQAIHLIPLSLDSLIKTLHNTKDTLTKEQIDALETLYNTIFIKNFIVGSNIICKIEKDEENAVLEYFSKQNPSPLHIYEYPLKGKIIVRFNLINAKKPILSINNISYKASKTAVNEPFPYTFKTKDGIFFIDKCNHLWTENVGAQSLDNKIFLQRHNLK